MSERGTKVGEVEVEGEVGRRTAWSAAYSEIETAERMMRWATTHHPMIVPLMQRDRVLEIGTGTGMLLRDSWRCPG